MKLTDKKIIEALKAGKEIRLCGGTTKYRLDKDDNIMMVDVSTPLFLNINLLKYDFEIVEPEIDWDEVVKEKYLCKFWNSDVEPTSDDCYVFGCLGDYTLGSDFCFMDAYYQACWQHCRPLRADEVKLVTDEKELLK